jgi:hypothetical protein
MHCHEPRKTCYLTSLLQTDTTRLETALLSVDREKFYLIEKFNLNRTVKITFQAEGNFTTSPEDFRNSEPEKHVADFLIRTAFSSAVLLKSERKKILAKLTETEKTTMKFHESEAEAYANKWKEKADNIFNITSFQPNYLFALYHPKFEKKWRKTKHKGRMRLNVILRCTR